MSETYANSETKIKESSFTPSLVLFWLKANYVLTNKRITGETPNTFLGIIPFGTKQIAQPLKTIASVENSTKFHFLRLAFGVLLILMAESGLSKDTESASASFFIFSIFGLINLANCYTSTLKISNTGGQTQEYEISILEKSKVKNFVDRTNREIAGI